MSTNGKGAVVLYDGACPLCRWEAGFFSKRDLDWRDLNLATTDTNEIDPDAARRRLHAIDAEGNVHVGFDAVLLVWSRWAPARPVVWLTGRRALRPAFAFFYEHAFAPLVVAWSRWRRR